MMKTQNKSMHSPKNFTSCNSITARRFRVVVVLFICLGMGWMSTVAHSSSGASPERAGSTAVTGNPPETPESTRGSQPTPTPIEAAEQAEEEAEEPAINAVYFGGDLYYGRTNLEGYRRVRDGFWATGTGLAYPSVLQLRLATRNRAEAKVAIGVGRFYTDDASTVDQPHEAWYRTPLRRVNLTVGKYYVPFAIQEWQYETKWGAMLEAERGANAFAVSLNHNQNLNTTNAYARFGRNFGENFNLGISAGAGRGLSYDTDFDRALGIDTTASWNGWNLYGEYVQLRRDSDEKFRFGWLKLEYDKLGRLKPFVAHWRWSDTTEIFGDLRSNAAGASYAITPELALEGGFANTSDDNIRWIQLHWTPEWRLWGDSPRESRRIPAAIAPQPR